MHRDFPGANLKKVWISARDGNVRSTHAVNDQESHRNPLPLDSYYPNGLLYPTDTSGPAKEVINCRCVETHVSGTLLRRSPNGNLLQRKARFTDGLKLVTKRFRQTYKEKLYWSIYDTMLKGISSNGKHQ